METGSNGIPGVPAIGIATQMAPLALNQGLEPANKQSVPELRSAHPQGRGPNHRIARACHHAEVSQMFFNLILLFKGRE